jgi:hypothetical protein
LVFTGVMIRVNYRFIIVIWGLFSCKSAIKEGICKKIISKSLV